MLKTKLQAQGERSAARQFVVEIERVEFVILVGDVEQAERDLSFPMRETITDKCIQLPEVIARFSGVVSAVVLRVPMGLGLGVETAGMIVNHDQIHLVENTLQTLLRWKIRRNE